MSRSAIPTWVNTRLALCHLPPRKGVLFIGVVAAALVSQLAPGATLRSVVASSASAGGQAAQTFVLDGVSLTVSALFQLPQFAAAGPDQLTQAASATSTSPFSAVTIVAVPFGTQPVSLAVPVASGGATRAYRDALTKTATAEGAYAMAAAPSISVFGKTASGSQFTRLMPVRGNDRATVVEGDWVVEAGSRVWIVTSIVERGSGAAVPSHLSGISITSPKVAAPSTLATSPAKPAATSPVPKSSTAPLAQAQGNLSYASWWTGPGPCAANAYYASPANGYPLSSGSSWLGMYACGRIPGNGNGGSDLPFPGGSFPGFQCAELSQRLMLLAFNIGSPSPQGSYYDNNGWALAYNYGHTYASVQWIANGTSGVLPQAGDVVSEGTSSPGHTYVIMSVGSVDLQRGNESITILEENNSTSGVRTLSVTGWTLSDGLGVTGWAHVVNDPYGSGSSIHSGDLLQFVNASPWTAYDISNYASGVQVAGNPSYTSGSAWARGANGDLQQFVNTPPWTPYDISAYAGGAKIAGDPAFDGTYVWARGTNGHLLAFYNNSPWTYVDISLYTGNTVLAGDPYIGGGAGIWARDINGDLLQFWYTTARGWFTTNFSQLVGGAKIAGNPMYDGRFVWARGTNNHLLQFAYSQTYGWQVWDITNYSGGVAISGDPVWAANSVWAADTNGGLRQFVNETRGWTPYDITAMEGSGIHVIGKVAFDGSSVWARDTTNHLRQFANVNGWHQWDISNGAGGVAIQSDPQITSAGVWATAA